MESGDENFELMESGQAINLVPDQSFLLWYVLGGILFVLILLLVVYLLKRKKAAPADPAEIRRAAYAEAKEAFTGIEETSPKETATDVSFVLRKYLAKALGDPAIFETHEELMARGDALGSLPEQLRQDVCKFFTTLAAAKYSGSGEASTSASELKSEGFSYLERIHKA